jgi:hypothetical protein
VGVLTAREIATQQVETFKAEKNAQDQRLEVEASKGRADMQTLLAKSSIGINIAENDANAVRRPPTARPTSSTWSARPVP